MLYIQTSGMSRRGEKILGIFKLDFLGDFEWFHTQKRSKKNCRIIRNKELQASIRYLFCFLFWNIMRFGVMSCDRYTQWERGEKLVEFSAHKILHILISYSPKKKEGDISMIPSAVEPCMRNVTSQQDRINLKKKTTRIWTFFKIHNSMIFAIINFAIPILAFLTSFDSQATSTMSWEGSHKKRACFSTCVSECRKSEAKTCPRLFIAIELN